MKLRNRVRIAWGGSVSAGFAALLLFGIGWIAPAPGRADDPPRTGVVFYYPNLDLGPAEVNGRYQLNGYLVNYTTSPVLITVIGTTGPFETPDAGGWTLLPANHYVTLPVAFVPKAVGPAAGELLVSTTFAPTPTVSLPLKGKGVDRDHLPDLSGVWNFPSDPKTNHKVSHDGSDRVAVALRFGDDSDKKLVGRFDGEWWTGEIIQTSGFGADGKPVWKTSGYFQLKLTQPDRLEGSTFDSNGAYYASGVMTRRSTFAGTWRVQIEVEGQKKSLGMMSMERITESQAMTLITRFPEYFGSLNVAGSVSWYYAEYPWSGRGAMLFYARNTYDAEEPPDFLLGRYGENLGTQKGSVAIYDAVIQRGLPITIWGWFSPDGFRHPSGDWIADRVGDE